MPGGAAVDGGGPRLLRHVRRHALLSQVGDELARVVGLVRAQRELVGCAWSLPVDHLQRRLALGIKPVKEACKPLANDVEPPEKAMQEIKKT